MVNQYRTNQFGEMDDTNLTPEELNQRLVRIEQRLDTMHRLISNHLGHQMGAITPNVPHPQMSAISLGKYTFTNGTLDRTMDCNSTTDAELADLIYTLWYDLSSVKILG
jgi:hypothetical protein